MTKACVKIAVIGVFSLVGACTGGSSTDMAHVRIVHVSPGTDSLNVTFDSATAASSLNYHGATSYQNIVVGSPEFKVTSAATGATFVDTTVTLTANTHYTFVV